MAMKATTWDNMDDNSTSLKDDDFNLEEFANLCLMVKFCITKKKNCLMTNSYVNIDEVNELDPQMTFDKLQNTFEKLCHDYKKLYKKNLLQNKLDIISKDLDVL